MAKKSLAARANQLMKKAEATEKLAQAQAKFKSAKQKLDRSR